MPLSTLSVAASPSASLAKRAGLVLGGSLLMALGARIAFDLGPVPLTFQPLALALVAALLGSRLAPAAMLAYLAEGAIGLPVFAGGAAGPQYLAGFSAGYLWSYPLAAWAIASVRESAFGATYAGRLAANLAGLAVVYAGGGAVLAAFVGPVAAFAGGVAPFVLADLAKMALAAAF